MPLVHSADWGYEPQAALLVGSGAGEPLAPVSLSVRAADGVHCSRGRKVRPSGSQLDEIEPVRRFAERQGWEQAGRSRHRRRSRFDRSLSQLAVRAGAALDRPGRPQRDARRLQSFRATIRPSTGASNLPDTRVKWQRGASYCKRRPSLATVRRIVMLPARITIRRASGSRRRRLQATSKLPNSDLNRYPGRAADHLEAAKVVCGYQNSISGRTAISRSCHARLWWYQNAIFSLPQRPRHLVGQMRRYEQCDSGPNRR